MQWETLIWDIFLTCNIDVLDKNLILPTVHDSLIDYGLKYYTFESNSYEMFSQICSKLNEKLGYKN